MSQSCIQKKKDRTPYKCSSNTKAINCGNIQQKPPKRHICSMDNNQCKITETGKRLNTIMKYSSIENVLEQIDSIQSMEKEHEIETLIKSLEENITQSKSVPKMPVAKSAKGHCGNEARSCKYKINNVTGVSSCRVGDGDSNDKECECKPSGPSGVRKCGKINTQKTQNKSMSNINSETFNQLRTIIGIEGHQLIQELEELYNQKIKPDVSSTNVESSEKNISKDKLDLIEALNTNQLKAYIHKIKELPFGKKDSLKKRLINYFKENPDVKFDNSITDNIQSGEDFENESPKEDITNQSQKQEHNKEIIDFVNELNSNQLSYYLQKKQLAPFGPTSLKKIRLINWFQKSGEDIDRELVRDIKQGEDEEELKGGELNNNYLEYESDISSSDYESYSDEIDYDSDNTLLLSDMDNSFLKDINNTESYPTSTIGTLTLNLDNLSSTT